MFAGGDQSPHCPSSFTETPANHEGKLYVTLLHTLNSLNKKTAWLSSNVWNVTFLLVSWSTVCSNRQGGWAYGCLLLVAGPYFASVDQSTPLSSSLSLMLFVFFFFVWAWFLWAIRVMSPKEGATAHINWPWRQSLNQRCVCNLEFTLSLQEVACILLVILGFPRYCLWVLWCL